MNRLDYFIAAMKAELYRNKSWVISAFATIQEAPEQYKQDPYPYRLVQSPTGVFYVNPDDISELLPLDMSDRVLPAGEIQPPFMKAEKVALKAGQVPNLSVDAVVSYGNILANYILLIWPFGAKIPFVQGRMMPDRLEEMILPLFVDEPVYVDANATVAPKKPNAIFVPEYLKFTNAMTYISGFASLWVSAGTEKSLLPPPGLKELKEKLFAQYKDSLKDPATLAVIAKELRDLDQQWLAGDDTLNFLIKSKSFEVVRAKKFLMVGAEAGLGDGQEVELIPRSLHEGWDIDSLPAMVNNLRAGSFNRGAETMRGGEAVKWLLRASSNVNIKPVDCGSRLGVKVLLTKENRKRYLNFTIVSDEPGLEKVRLTEEVIDNYIGKRIRVRSPMYCKLPFTDYCSVCVGPRLEANPTGASSAIANYGSTMLLMCMKAVHGKALLLAKYDYKARIL
jgi:hypothetical protein